MPKKRYYASSMMPSGMGQFANMPQASFVKTFPTNSYMSTPEYVDTLSGVDRQISGAVGKAKSQPAKSKF